MVLFRLFSLLFPSVRSSIDAIVLRCFTYHFPLPLHAYMPVTVINVRDIRLLSNITFSNSTTTTTVWCCEARAGHYESESNRRRKSPHHISYVIAVKLLPIHHHNHHHHHENHHHSNHTCILKSVATRCKRLYWMMP